MSSQNPGSPLSTIRLALGLTAAGAALVFGAVATATAQQPSIAETPGGAGGASTTTNPLHAPSTPQIAFASPPVKAPPYGKS